MRDILASGSEHLIAAGYSTRRLTIGQRDALIFEGKTAMGFAFVYKSVSELLQHWSSDSDRAISAYQFGLRKSGVKAWNTYLVLLTNESPRYADVVSLGALEENLSGTRKIVRGGIQDGLDVAAALLPLLPLQSAPRLEAVDMAKEIRERTTELPSRVVEAFLSDAEEAVVLQVLEESP